MLVLACLIATPVWAIQFDVQTRMENQQHIADIIVNDAPEVYGGDVNVTFDTTAVKIMDMDAKKDGIQIVNGSFFGEPNFPILNEVNTEKGEINYAISMVYPAKSVSGNGVVASIYYTPLNDNHKTAFKVAGSEFGSAEGVGYRTGNKVRNTKKAPNAARQMDKKPSATTTESHQETTQKHPTILYLGIGLGILLLSLIGFFLIRKKT